MIRKFKTLSMALVAVLALGAVAASSAMAEGEYTAAEYSTTATGTSPLGNDVFTTEGGTVECASHFEATLAAPSSSLTAKAKYTGCRAFGFLEATVNMGSCDYLFTTPTLVETPTANNHVWTIGVHVKCTNAAEPIKIVAGTCEATVGEQSPGGHVIATATTNTPSKPDDIDVRATVTGIKYTVTKDGFLCPFSGTGAKTGGTYEQEEEFTFSSTNGKSITIS